MAVPAYGALDPYSMGLGWMSGLGAGSAYGPIGQQALNYTMASGVPGGFVPGGPQWAANQQTYQNLAPLDLAWQEYTTPDATQLAMQTTPNRTQEDIAHLQAQNNQDLAAWNALSRLNSLKQLGGVFGNLFGGLGSALGGIGNSLGGAFGGGGFGGGFGGMHSNSGAGFSFGAPSAGSSFASASGGSSPYAPDGSAWLLPGVSASQFAASNGGYPIGSAANLGAPRWSGIAAPSTPEQALLMSMGGTSKWGWQV